MKKQTYEELESQSSKITDAVMTCVSKVEELQAQVKQLAAENAALKEIIEQHANCVAVCPNCCHEEPSETDDIVALYRAMETPATDAYAASLRAEVLPDNIADIIDSGDLEAICWHSNHASSEQFRMALYNFRQLRSKSEVQS